MIKVVTSVLRKRNIEDKSVFDPQTQADQIKEFLCYIYDINQILGLNPRQMRFSASKNEWFFLITDRTMIDFGYVSIQIEHC